MYTERDLYIKDQLEDYDVNRNTIDFFISLLDLFRTTEHIDTTTRTLAESMNKSERSIQRYVKTLQEIGFLHVRPIWNNENPDKPYRVKNIYSLTERARRIVGDASLKYPNREKIKVNTLGFL